MLYRTLKLHAFLILFFVFISEVSHGATKSEIRKTVDCAVALRVIKMWLEDHGSVETTNLLIDAHDRKIYVLLDAYTERRLERTQSGILNIPRMTSESFEIYYQKLPHDQLKYAKSVVESNRCLHIEEKYKKEG